MANLQTFGPFTRFQMTPDPKGPWEPHRVSGALFAQTSDGVNFYTLQHDTDIQPPFALISATGIVQALDDDVSMLSCPDDGEIIVSGAKDAEIGHQFKDGAFSEVEVTIEEKRELATLERGQFCLALMVAKKLPPSEAIAASKGEWPATFAAALSDMDEGAAAAAQIEWASVQTVRRIHPLIGLLATFAGFKEAEVDALFGIE